MIQAIWRLFSVCSIPTQIKCLKHLIVGERALVALERAMGNCSGEKNSVWLAMWLLETSTARLIELLPKCIFLGNIISMKRVPEEVPVGVLLLNEDEGVMGGVTGGVRLPLLWRGGVATLLRERLPISERDSFGWTFFFRDSCSRRAASVMNLEREVNFIRWSS